MSRTLCWRGGLISFRRRPGIASVWLSAWEPGDVLECSGPPEDPAARSCLEASTSEPGRRRALGRAGFPCSTRAAESRRARLFQAAALVLHGKPISEPETALRVRLGEQNAGAAQHRPRCKASS